MSDRSFETYSLCYASTSRAGRTTWRGSSSVSREDSRNAEFRNSSAPIATEANLPANRRHVQVLRHSAAVHVLDAGEDIDFARDHLGHRSIQSTMTYAQISDARRNRKMRRLERSREFPIPS